MSFFEVNILSNLFSIKLCYIKNYKLFLIVYKNNTTFYRPISSLHLLKNKIDLLRIESSFSYLNCFSSFYRNLIFKARGFLILRGLGLKVQIIDNFLELKLGFSHRCLLKIEPEIWVRIKKNLIFFQSINCEKLGNFLYKIKNLRKPDAYKGKGIWYKNEKICLKPVKKSK